MNIDKYQDLASSYAVYDENAGHGFRENIEYCTLGLVGEAGEVANKVKKIKRDGVLDYDGILDEIGDVLWYASQLCGELGFTLSRAAEVNLLKLQSRYERDKLKGSGDER
jgi:NTP pyrophosphatase (non-canonical NTP hydrolase)